MEALKKILWALIFSEKICLRQSEKIYSNCVLKTYDFISIYSIYLQNVRVITLRILDTENPAQDLGYFADEIARIVFTKTRKKVVLWERKFAHINFTSKTITPELTIPKRYDHRFPRGTFRNVTTKIKFNWRDKQRAFIILVWNEQVLNKALDDDPESVVTYRRALYFIIFVEDVTRDFKAKNDTFLPVLHRFWYELRIVNVMATTLCHTSRTKNIFIFNPFYYEDSKWGVVKVLSISDIFSNPNSMFDFMEDFNGFPIKVSLFPRFPTALESTPRPLLHVATYNLLKSKSGGYGGVDGCLVAFLAEKLNFTTIVSQPKDGEQYGYVNRVNQSVYGSLGEVINSSVDISANGRFMYAYGVEDFEFTNPVTNNLVCPVVPKSEKIPQWRMIFQGFTTDTWLFIIGVGVICSCFWYIVEPVNIPRKHTRSFVQASLDIVAVILNMPIKLPTKLGQRIFMASLLSLNVIVMGIFQGTLVQSFTTVSYYPDINTLQQLDKSELPIATSIQVFNNEPTAIMKKLSKKVIWINSTALTRAAFNRDVAAIERKQDAAFYIRMNYTKNGLPLLHIVNECPSSYFIAYIVPKFSPFLPKFNSLILDFFEAGLTNKWYDDFIEGLILEQKSLDMESNRRKPFALNDIQTAFYIIIFGNVLSFVILLAEICMAKFLLHK